MKIITGTKTIILREHGIHCLTPHIGSLDLSHITETADGRDGNILLESSYNARVISSDFLVKSRDRIDLDLLRNELYRLFSKKEEFYIIFDREPLKRWKVILNKAFELNRINAITGEFDLEFISFSPFAQSVGTTLDPLTFTADVWQVDQGILAENVKYIHSTQSFELYNAGDITIDPRELPLKIIFKGTSENLSIINQTTGDNWSYQGMTTIDDVVTLDGIRSLKNNQSIFKYTNKNLITLAPGWNSFKITGSTDFSISFDFRFYYV